MIKKIENLDELIKLLDAPDNRLIAYIGKNNNKIPKPISEIRYMDLTKLKKLIRDEGLTILKKRA